MPMPPDHAIASNLHRQRLLQQLVHVMIQSLPCSAVA